MERQRPPRPRKLIRRAPIVKLPAQVVDPCYHLLETEAERAGISMRLLLEALVQKFKASE